MGVSLASLETHERVRKILLGPDWVVQIKEGIEIHGKSEEHHFRLRDVFGRLGCYTDLEEMLAGKDTGQWSWFVCDKDRMRKDLEEMETICKWKERKKKLR